MPPFLPRKRLSSTPPLSSRTTPAKKAKLYDALDAQHSVAPTLSKHFTLPDSDSDSSLSDVESDEFENVPTKAVKLTEQLEDEEDEDDDIDWEDATRKEKDAGPSHVPMAGGDIQLIFRKDDNGHDYTVATGKKGPTKKERESRMRAHTMHVQFLLYHNAIRNAWICDKGIQDILVRQLPAQIKRDVEQWRVASGLRPREKRSESSPKGKNKVGKKQKTQNERNERDWGNPSQRLEAGKPDLSRGEPLIPLMKILAKYWKKRFHLTAPGLRKRGYGTKAQLKEDISSYRNDEHDPERHGEKIRSLEDFREMARTSKGSRDAGAQLFTALCRALGIESRLVASLQPSGFGWSKTEQMAPRKPADVIQTNRLEENSEDSEGDGALKAQPKSGSKTMKSKSKAKGQKNTPIDLESDVEESVEENDDGSVVDVTPSILKATPPKYDRDLPFPIYWTEIISPISHNIIPVSPLVVGKDHTVATTAEALLSYEPRGAKAEKAKMVIAYVVAYSSDGTAKDVTTRYLKRRMWPGKTRGVRIPVEKYPVYDKNGKIKRYEDYDWFKQTMSGYMRTDEMRTAVDEMEDASDLVPKQPENKKKEDEADTLQSLKSSADFVLERHLRREEALLPGAIPDRTFDSGKPDTNTYRTENVYLRKDVVKCLTTESWHKIGRIPKPGQTALKQVPVRAVTLTRKREAEEHQRQTGEKQMQGLYSEAQTEYIIPAPIKDGIIPKNSYGNIDCFVESMVPKGAVHLPLKGSVRICKKLEVDYAEAVVGFEFGNKMAVPVIQGVVVAEENEKAVREAWEVYAEQQRIKEEGKMEKLVLDKWRKLLMGLRIRERVEEDYGEEGDRRDAELASNDLKRGETKFEPINIDQDEDEGMHEAHDLGGGFILPHEDDESDASDLVLEHHEHKSELTKLKAERKSEAAQYPTPTSEPFISAKKPSRRLKKSLLQIDDSDGTEDSALSELSEDTGSEFEHENQATENSAPRDELHENEEEHNPPPSSKPKGAVSRAYAKAYASVPSQTPAKSKTSKVIHKVKMETTQHRLRSRRNQSTVDEEKGKTSPYFSS